MRALLVFLALATFFNATVLALDEPPGSESVEEAEAYLRQLEEDRKVGKIYMEPGVERSWDRAMVFTPEHFFTQTPNDLKLSKRYPVVIYLHGCSGITSNHDTLWGKYLADLGFVAILPDSLARPKVVSNCDPQFHSANWRFPLALAFREHEIGYALQQLKKLDWVDQRNVFLMGHSQGANAISQTVFTGFRGMILSSGYCFSGVIFDKDIPGIAINYTNDPWHKGAKSRCSVRGNGQPLEYVELQGASHDTFQVPAARNAVKAFLEKNSKY